VNHTRCEFEGCDKIQIFGSPADRMVRSCKAHKLEGYVNVMNKMCGEVDGCEANYCSDTEDVVRFCKPHSNDGAVYLSKLRCVAPGCDALVGDRGRRRGAALHGVPGAGVLEPGGAACRGAGARRGRQTQQPGARCGGRGRGGS
jgi:hypothetical protein